MNHLARPDEERKVVTVLFADLVSSTELASRLDPEDLRSVQEAYFGALREEIVRLGGTVEKFIGDAVVAVFGAPTAHEDDPVRAARTALAMRQRVADLTGDLERELGAPLELRIGITTGEVVTISPREDGIVVGETMNIASRLQAIARAGSIVVDDRTHRRSHEAFDYRSLGSVTVKGIDRPLSAWELIDRRAPAAPRPQMTPLIGRDREVEMLTHLLEDVTLGRGGVLTITGEPGVGKSRLLAEANALAEARGFAVAQGRGSSFPASSGYPPFQGLFSDLLGIGTGGDEAGSWTRYEASMRRLAAQEADDLLPYVGILLGLDVPQPVEYRVRYLDGTALRNQIFRAARRLVTAVASRGGIVLVLDDLHWFDLSSATLAEHLVPLVRSLPVAILATTRPDPAGGRPGLVDECARTSPDRLTEIYLEPLPATGTARMMEELLPGGPLPDDLIRLVHRRAGGTPLFVEEVVEVLRGASVIVRHAPSGRWQLSQSVGDVSLPDTLRSVLTARLDSLPSEMKDLVKKASVIGQVFAEEILRGVTPTATLAQDLSQLERRGFVRPQPGHRGAWEFRHPAIQETAYASILRRDRAKLHDLVAASIEVTHPDRLDQFAATLAHHYVLAERWDRAHRYLFEAGERASRMAADAESIELFQSAVSTYGRAFGDRWDPLERALLERRLGEALFRRGDHASAIQHLRSALRYLGARDPYASSRVGPAIAREGIRQVVRLPFDRPGRGRSHESDIAAEERARVYNVMAWIDFFTDPRRFALNRLISARVEGRVGGSPLGMALAYAGLGATCDMIPALRLAEIYHRRAVTLAEDIGHPLAVGQTHFVFGLHAHHGAGSMDDALDHYRTAVSAYREAGELRGAGASEWFIAWIDALRGDLQPAEQRWIALDALAQDAGDPIMRGWALMGLGSLSWRTGDPTQAVDRLQEAVRLFDSIPDHQSRTYAAGHLAIALLHQGDTVQAGRTITDVEAEIRARGLRGFPCTPHRVAAAELELASLGGGDARHVRGARKSVRRLFRQARIDRDCLPEAWRLAGSLAWSTAKVRKAERSWTRGVEIARAMGARYDEARLLLEMARRLGGRPAAGEADELLSSMGLAARSDSTGVGIGRSKNDGRSQP